MKQKFKDFVSIEEETFISSFSGPLRLYLITYNQVAKQWRSVELAAKILLELNALHITKDYIMRASGQKRHNFQRISWKYQRFTWVISRSSRPEGFFKRDVLEDLAKFKGNAMYWSLFLIKVLNKVAVLHPATSF